MYKMIIGNEYMYITIIELKKSVAIKKAIYIEGYITKEQRKAIYDEIKNIKIDLNDLYGYNNKVSIIINKMA